MRPETYLYQTELFEKFYLAVLPAFALEEDMSFDEKADLAAIYARAALKRYNREE